MGTLLIADESTELRHQSVTTPCATAWECASCGATQAPEIARTYVPVEGRSWLLAICPHCAEVPDNQVLTS